METKIVFEFDDYKAYLKDYSAKRPKGGRGFRAEIARFAHCQTAYVSQVLNSTAHFSLEQAQALNGLLLHNKEEGHYFLLLVQFARAGSADLKSYFRELMEEAIQKQLNLKSRFKVRESLSLENQTTFYSEWFYSAIHILVSIPEYQTRQAISGFFGLSENKVDRILRFLISAGLVREEGNRLFLGTSRIHLGSDSYLLSKYHCNWRLQAIQSLEKENREDLHYTSIVSVSERDILKIKSRFVKEIESFNSIVKDSKEEALQCFTLDFFSLKRS